MNKVKLTLIGYTGGDAAHIIDGLTLPEPWADDYEVEIQSTAPPPPDQPAARGVDANDPLVAALVDVTKRNVRLSDECDRWEGVALDRATEVGQLRKTNAELMSDNDDLTAQVVKLQFRYDELSQAGTELQSRYEIQCENNTTLSSLIGGLERELAKARDEHTITTDDLSKTDAENIRLNLKNDELQQRVNNQTIAIKRYQSEKDAMVVQGEDLRRQAIAAEGRCKTYEEQIGYLRRDIVDHMKQRDHCRNEAARMTDLIASQAAEISELKMRMSMADA